MVTDCMLALLLRAAILSGLTALFATSTVAKETIPRSAEGIVGIVDARHGGRAVKLNVSQPVREKQLRYLNLSQVEPTQSSCCVTIGKRTAKGEAGSEVRAGTLSRRASLGFFGVVFATAPSHIERTSPNEVLLSWRASGADAASSSVRLIHCVSAEGLNVRVLKRAGGTEGAELRRYYVPLGMDVEPDCTPALMPLR